MRRDIVPFYLKYKIDSGVELDKIQLNWNDHFVKEKSGNHYFKPHKWEKENG